MSCHVVGAHRHQWRKRLRRKVLSLLPWAEWKKKGKGDE